MGLAIQQDGGDCDGHGRLRGGVCPATRLDADLRVTLRSELRQLQRHLGLTTIYVTHDREDAAALADRIIQMRDGRIASEWTGVPSEERS